jgi:arabinogalactan endo-1,4-beta-galactosidase
VDARARAAEDRARVALHVAVTDNEGLYTFVIDRLTRRPEVADVQTSVVYEHIRNPHIQPAD